MLNKVVGLGTFFIQKKVDHPLADPREARRILSELPKDNAFKALDEISVLFESLTSVPDFPGDRLFEVIQQLEEAAQPYLKRVARDYFQPGRLSRSDEIYIWSATHGFWQTVADAYERCLAKRDESSRAGALSRANLPQLFVRLMVSLGHLLKWEQFYYGPSRNDLWRRFGATLLLAEGLGVASKAVAVQGKSGMTSVVQEYQKVMVFQAASLDSLLPLEIELAERLISHFMGSFVFTTQALPDSVYWSDLNLAQPPLRLARMPAQAEPTQRFMKPGPAHEAMRTLLESLERGVEMPANIDLGGQYPVPLLVTVLRHLTNYLSGTPPQRQHDRHRVGHRMSVVHGLLNAFKAFSAAQSGVPAGTKIESWLVENVSRGGFGAMLNTVPGEWLRVGALIAMQPEGGDNWLLGVVRRYHREAQSEARVGVQALATKVAAVELRKRSASTYAAASGTPALLLLDGNDPDELRVAMPLSSFSPREDMEYAREGRRYLLKPIAQIEKTVDFELVRYRQSILG